MWIARTDLEAQFFSVYAGSVPVIEDNCCVLPSCVPSYKLIENATKC